jgi:toxin secretion/phage lysis holin
MANIITLIKHILAAIASFWFGLNTAIHILLYLMALDMLTGVIAAGKLGSLSSGIAALGIRRKAGILIIITALHFASDQLGNHLKTPVDLSPWVALFYVLSELVSVVENCGRLGAPIPKLLLNTIAKAKRTVGT